MDKIDPAPVYYFYGDEDLLIEEAIVAIKKKYLSPGFESMNLQVYEGKTIDVVDAVSVASTMPAFSQMRIVIVGGVESIKAADQKALLAYVKDPSPSTAFIFFARTYKVNKTAALFKYINSKKWTRLFRELSEDEAARWSKKYAAENGKTMSVPAARRLVTITGTRLRDLKGELEKLISYVGSADSIEEGDVEQSALSIKDDNAFDLAGAMAAKELGQALVLLKTLSGEEPLMVIGALAWNFRQLVRVKSLMGEGLDKYALSRQLHVSALNVGRYQAACRRFSEGELLSVISRLGEADTAIKTGLLPGVMALRSLVVGCCRT
jgi:DNA polymerase-3 subunit delta